MLIIPCQWEQGGHGEVREIMSGLGTGSQIVRFGLADCLMRGKMGRHRNRGKCVLV